MMHNKIKKIVLAGLFIALEIILTRFLSVESQIVRVSFEFIPIALSAILFGPVVAGGAAAVADVLGFFIFSKGGPFFPGFTISAFITGFIYGIVLYKKNVNLLRTFISALLVNIICSLILNTVWLVILTGNGAYAILVPRLVKVAIFIPLQTIVVYAFWKSVGIFFRGKVNSLI